MTESKKTAPAAESTKAVASGKTVTRVRPDGYIDEKELAYDSKNTGPDGPADPEGGSPKAVVSHQYMFPPNPDPDPGVLADKTVADPRTWKKVKASK